MWNSGIESTSGEYDDVISRKVRRLSIGRIQGYWRKVVNRNGICAKVAVGSSIDSNRAGLKTDLEG